MLTKSPYFFTTEFKLLGTVFFFVPSVAGCAFFQSRDGYRAGGVFWGGHAERFLTVAALLSF